MLVFTNECVSGIQWIFIWYNLNLDVYIGFKHLWEQANGSFLFCFYDQFSQSKMVALIGGKYCKRGKIKRANRRGSHSDTLKEIKFVVSHDPSPPPRLPTWGRTTLSVCRWTLGWKKEVIQVKLKCYLHVVRRPVGRRQQSITELSHCPYERRRRRRISPRGQRE